MMDGAKHNKYKETKMTKELLYGFIGMACIATTIYMLLAIDFMIN